MKIFFVVLISAFIFLNFSCANSGANSTQASNQSVLTKKEFAPIYDFKRDDKKISAGQHLLKQIASVNKLKGSVSCKAKPCQFLSEQLIKRMPFYQKYILEGIIIAKENDLQIDMFAYLHQTIASLGGDKAEQKSVDGSKQIVIALNEQLHPDLMGVEGCYGKVCDLSAEYQDTVRLQNDLGMAPMSQEQMERTAGVTTKDNWYYEYRKHYPDASIIGVDDYELQSSEQLIEMVLERAGWSEGMTFVLREPVIRLRSYVAYAKMAHFLKENGLRHGTITLGYFHGSDFKQIAEDYGAPVRIYVAIPQWVLDDPNEERFEPF